MLRPSRVETELCRKQGVSRRARSRARCVEAVEIEAVEEAQMVGEGEEWLNKRSRGGWDNARSESHTPSSANDGISRCRVGYEMSVGT